MGVDKSKIISYDFFSDLAISKLKDFKNRYESVDETNSYKDAKDLLRDMRDTKYIFSELYQMALLKQREIKALIREPLDDQS
ncbi:MAG: hypothetical protein M0R17_00100 [Candidatus Omnitrophica bacterium]|jgi:glutaredoxin-related protein|nr:hypothetical protein [Candidatus Omnitrophota bacterium]